MQCVMHGRRSRIQAVVRLVIWLTTGVSSTSTVPMCRPNLLTESGPCSCGSLIYISRYRPGINDSVRYTHRPRRGRTVHGAIPCEKREWFVVTLNPVE